MKNIFDGDPKPGDQVKTTEDIHSGIIDAGTAKEGTKGRVTGVEHRLIGESRADVTFEGGPWRPDHMVKGVPVEKLDADKFGRKFTPDKDPIAREYRPNYATQVRDRVRDSDNPLALVGCAFIAVILTMSGALYAFNAIGYFLWRPIFIGGMSYTAQARSESIFPTLALAGFGVSLLAAGLYLWFRKSKWAYVVTGIAALIVLVIVPILTHGMAVPIR